MDPLNALDSFTASQLIMNHDDRKLTEEYVQDSFHSYLKSSLTHAKVERLLEPEVLASAEGDLMITGMEEIPKIVLTFCLTYARDDFRSSTLSLFCRPALHHLPTISTTSQKLQIGTPP